MRKLSYFLILVGILAGCVPEAVLEDQQYCTLQAGFSETGTRVGLTLSDSSLDVITKWQESDMIKSYLYGSGRIVENPPVHIHNINPDGKGCEFTFRVDPNIGYLRDGYNLLAYTLGNETDELQDPQDVSTAPSLDYSLYRAPLSSFRAPVLFFGHITDNIVYCRFSHLYTYEVLHVSNLTERDINFSLNGFESDTQWYKLFCSFDVTNDGVVQGIATSSTCHPVEVSEGLTIPANSTGAIVSAYVPTGQKIQDARMVATIDGNVVKSENTKSSEVSLQQGHAYHLYASWSNGRLRFESGTTEAPVVETLTAKVDDKNTAALLIGTVTNRSLSGLTTGFRVWKNGDNMDYVEYESTFTQDNMFRLDLYSSDLRYIAGDASVYGSYKAQAYAIDESGVAGYGGIKEFTIVKPSGTGSPEAVDLGLSIKWATCNVGASRPEEHGDYFAWGETEPKDEYWWSTYKWCSNGNPDVLLKYTVNSYFSQYSYPVDGKMTLDLEDDAANASLGGYWRTPSMSEIYELAYDCLWTWTTQNGVNGYKVSGTKEGYTDNYIFLPVTGKWSNKIIIDEDTGYYWTNSLVGSPSDVANCLFFTSKGAQTQQSKMSRMYGLAVRPVYAGVTGISLSESDIVLHEGWTEQLVASIVPEGAINKEVIWASTNSDVATVSSDGLVKAVKAGQTTITATTVDEGFSASCTVKVEPSFPLVTPEAIDLGLSVLWANMDIGATEPEGTGDFFAWGETSPKRNYDWDTYKWSGENQYSLTKYNTASRYGNVDGKSSLDPEDDAVRVLLGGVWRLPTKDEYDEINNRSNCSWERVTVNGVNCFRVTSLKPGYTDKSILLPITGFMEGGWHNEGDRYIVNTSIDNNYPFSFYEGHHRCYGYTLRPVCD